MTSSTEALAPKCPDCDAPMRLTRVLPTVLPKKYGTETYVFVCTSCGSIATRTVRAPHHTGDPIEPMR